MSKGQVFRLHTEFNLDSSSLVVLWNQDVGKVGQSVANYLNEKLASRELAEIDPEGFFPLSGVAVGDDVVRFPESKFYLCKEENLVVFKSDIPQHEWYHFLDLILDIAEQYCRVKEVYTVGGMVSTAAHTMSRMLLSVVNSTELKMALDKYNIINDMNYDTQDGQRPTFSSFLLWAARRRSIKGANLWLPVPFYLLSVGDPQACKSVIEFFNDRLELDIDFADMNEEVSRQNQKIAQIRSQFPEIDGYISKLESSLSLTVDESEKLVSEIAEVMRKRH